MAAARHGEWTMFHSASAGALSIAVTLTAAASSMAHVTVSRVVSGIGIRTAVGGAVGGTIAVQNYRGNPAQCL